MAAARPLSPKARGQFLEAVAARLQEVKTIGDGAVFRTVAEVQQKFFDPPDLGRAAGSSKWSR
jgi:hypothetical protein